jgi:hypothetical protein
MPESQEVGPNIFRTTMHQRILQALSLRFGETRDPHFMISTLLPRFSAG